MLSFKNFLNESSLTEQEKDALWYWQEGNNGKGYQILRSIANGRCPTVRGIEKLKEIEKDFESAIISHITDFLLEMGKGFSFVARQKRILIEDDEFFIDMFFL